VLGHCRIRRQQNADSRRKGRKQCRVSHDCILLWSGMNPVGAGLRWDRSSSPRPCAMRRLVVEILDRGA
jgi:hypothetical protein